MRRLAICVLLATGLAVAPLAAGAAAPFRATLTAPGHTPKVATKWYYVIHATDLHGRPIAARLTMQIKDPTGQVHAVQYGPTKKNITNWPIKGRFRDYIIWPKDSVLASVIGGLQLRAIVTAGGRRTMLTYRVKPR